MMIVFRSLIAAMKGPMTTSQLLEGGDKINLRMIHLPVNMYGNNLWKQPTASERIHHQQEVVYEFRTRVVRKCFIHQARFLCLCQFILNAPPQYILVTQVAVSYVPYEARELLKLLSGACLCPPVGNIRYRTHVLENMRLCSSSVHSPGIRE